MWAWLNPAKWVKGARVAAQLELLEKLAEAQEKISDLQVLIDELREQLRSADSENEVLRTHIRRLEQAANVKQAVRFERNAVWTGEGDSELAHCQTCYGKDQKLIPLNVNRYSNGAITASCGSCNSRVVIQRATEQDPPPRRGGWMDGYR